MCGRTMLEFRARTRHTVVPARNPVFAIVPIMMTSINILPAARRHRRAGRVGQDRPHARAVPRAARPLRYRRRHQRHLHRRGCEIPGAAIRHCSAERILGVETGGCPHTAIREDASINLEAVRACRCAFPGLDLIFVESGGDNLAATFSPGTVGSDALRHRRRGGRQDSAQGRTRNHQIGPAWSSTRSILRPWWAHRSR